MRNVLQYYKQHGLLRTLIKARSRGFFAVRRAYHRAMKTAFVRSKYGVLLQSRWDDATFELCLTGAYGTLLSDFLTRMDRPFVFLDIGANQGLYSLIAARNHRCAQVVAFEPLKETYEILLSNIGRNGYPDRIRAVPAAVSSEKGSAAMKVMAGHSGTASIAHGFDSVAVRTEHIKLIAHQDLEALVPEDSVLVVKMDVEGHEETVLRELLKCRFFDRIEAIHYEVNEDWSDGRAMQSALASHGFRELGRKGSGRQYDVLALREIVENGRPKC